jgi:CheY-like chemotaxis protein
MTTDKIQIILADDNPLEHMLFGQVLKALPHVSLSSARDGQELLSMLLAPDATLPHIIFLNIHMPVKNGIECLTDIKQNKKLLHLPVVMYSTADEEKEVEQTYTLGANLYIRKPLEYDDLKKSIVWLVTHYSQKGMPYFSREEYVFKLNKHDGVHRR